MKRQLLAPVALVASLTLMGLVGCQAAGQPTAPQPGSSAAGQTSAVLPVSSNPIVNTSTAPGLTIVSAAAENNVDPSTKAPISDRLQVTVRNDSASELSQFEVYYTMTDVTTKQSESYYQALTGFTVAAGSEATFSFDGDTGAGHFPENKFSLYRSSTNQVDFTIEVSAAGVAVATAAATKGAGTGETGD